MKIKQTEDLYSTRIVSLIRPKLCKEGKDAFAKSFDPYQSVQLAVFWAIRLFHSWDIEISYFSRRQPPVFWVIRYNKAPGSLAFRPCISVGVVNKVHNHRNPTEIICCLPLI